MINSWGPSQAAHRVVGTWILRLFILTAPRLRTASGRGRGGPAGSTRSEHGPPWRQPDPNCRRCGRSRCSPQGLSNSLPPAGHRPPALSRTRNRNRVLVPAQMRLMAAVTAAASAILSRRKLATLGGARPCRRGQPTPAPRCHRCRGRWCPVPGRVVQGVLPGGPGRQLRVRTV